MYRLALLLLVPLLWADSPLQPNTPITKNGVTVTVTCPVDCASPPTIINVYFEQNSWAAPLAFGVYTDKNNQFKTAGVVVVRPTNGNNVSSFFLYSDAPNDVKFLYLYQMQPGNYFGATK